MASCFATSLNGMMSFRLLLAGIAPQLSTCFVSTTEIIRRQVVDVVPQLTEAGCKIMCRAKKCEATLLSAAGTHCILLGAQIADATSNACPRSFTSYVKTECGCVDLPQGPISAGYTPGSCSRSSDILHDLAIDGSSHTCGTATAALQRIVIDGIQHDGTRIVLENYYVSRAVCDVEVGSWYVDLVEAPANCSAAKCVLAPTIALAPECECAPLPLDPLEADNSNPIAPVVDADPSCPSSASIQMAYLRLSSSKTWGSGYRMISCTMGEWMLIYTSGSFNSYALSAATCVN